MGNQLSFFRKRMESQGTVPSLVYKIGFASDASYTKSLMVQCILKRPEQSAVCILPSSAIFSGRMTDSGHFFLKLLVQPKSAIVRAFMIIFSSPHITGILNLSSYYCSLYLPSRNESKWQMLSTCFPWTGMFGRWWGIE